MIAEAAARWFASRREELNQRFALQRRQFPALNPQHVLALMEQIIAPLAGDQPEADELCLSVFELILLHAARNSFAVRPGIKFLMCSTFPRIRMLLLKSPRDLPGSLCNATENLGRRGVEFAEKLGAMARSIATPEILLAMGVVLAWRLGEARLRTQALRAASTLPPRVVLETLDLSGWPDSALSLVLAAFEQDGWRAPRVRLSEQTLETLAKGKVKTDELIRTLQSAPVPPLREWTVDFHVGDFSGFDGSFEALPLILNGGDRHTFLVRSRDRFFQLTADCFGWVCRAIEEPAPHALMPGSASVWSRLGLPDAADGSKQLSPDAELAQEGESTRSDALKESAFASLRRLVGFPKKDSGQARISLPRTPALKEATSFVPFQRLLAFTTKDSYRVRILLPPASVI